MSSPEDMVSVRYMVDDVQAAIDFYTGHLGFTVRTSAAPAFADVTRGNLRLLLAGPGTEQESRCPTAASPSPAAGTVSTSSSLTSQPRSPGCVPRACISATTSLTGPGGEQILIEDPAGNVVELFEPASAPPSR